MLRKKKGNIEWLEFPLLSTFPEITHGIFLRHGGQSEGAFATFNLNRKIEEDEENVFLHRKQIKEILGLEKLLSPEHAHSSHVAITTSDEDTYAECDGLITTEKSCGLLTLHADCQAALFYDPVNQVVASVHAGWRGQVQEIYKKTIIQMTQKFGTKPKELLVCISPSLGPESAEFKNYQSELPEIFWKFQIRPTYFDLWAIARHQLEEAGVLSEHIEIANIDTFMNPEDFYSYRRETKAGRKLTGNNGTVIGLK